MRDGAVRFIQANKPQSSINEHRFLYPLILLFALYIDDVLSLNNPKFYDYIYVIYSKELEIKDTTDAPKWDNYLDLHLEFDEDGKLFT